MRAVTSESFEPSKGKLNEADHIEHVNSMTILVRCKLTIWNVMHHFKEECAFNDNVKLLTSLFRSIVVAVTVMKKTHKKPILTLMNLIWEAQLQDAYVFKIEIALNSECLSECEKALWKWDTEGIFCKNKIIYLSDNVTLKAEIIRCHYNNLHVKHYVWKWIKELIQRKFYWKTMNHDIYQYVQDCVVC